MMTKVALCLLIALIVGFALRPSVSAEGAVYYEGKTIRFVVGSAPGGGLDTYTRVIARHMGRHINGNPTIIVEICPGQAA